MTSSNPDLAAAAGPSPARWVVVVLAALAVPALYLALRPGAPPPPSSFEVVVSVTPPDARIGLDQRPVAVGAWRATLPRDGRPHLLTLDAAGHQPQRIYFTDAPPPRAITLQPLAP